MSEVGQSNIGIGIANAAWVLSIASIVIFAHVTPWILIVPIFINWSFIKD